MMISYGEGGEGQKVMIGIMISGNDDNCGPPTRYIVSFFTLMPSNIIIYRYSLTTYFVKLNIPIHWGSTTDRN